jgi:iron complex transport system ATP-binding protein
VIELQTISVRLGETEALRGVSLSVEAGEWVAVIGPNGAGKTTALRALCGLVDYDGVVYVDGRDTRTLSRRALARLTALVPQIPETPPGLTVAEYVLLGRTPHLGYFAMESAGDRRAAERALDRLELRPLAGRTLTALSGGELQRVVLARALAQEAPILLLDEPTTALDLGRQQQALELVHTLREGSGLTIVSTMHDLTLAGQYADRLVLLDRGEIVADGAPEEVLSAANVSAYYGASVRVVRDDDGVFVLPVRR